MTSDGTEHFKRSPARPRKTWAGLLLVLAIAGFLRLEGLGTRSLWRDELCTWHVSRMDFGESLRWGPELTKPPLYQIALRGLTQDPKPSEFTLRLPAAICGIATVLACWWFGAAICGWGVGMALALLVSFNDLQVFYSQEARPYSMLALGTVLSTLLIYQFVIAQKKPWLWAYSACIVLTLYAHYLAILAIAAHGIWWLIVLARQDRASRSYAPLVAWILSGALCIPLVIRYIRYKTGVFQGLEWIKTPTITDGLDILGQLTAGPYWLLLGIVPAIALLIAGQFGASMKWRFQPTGPLWDGPKDVCVLLLLVVLGSWGGLLVISWIAHPAMVARYALPAAIPALLIPLVIAYRVDRRLPLGTALFFILLTSPQWTNRDVEPGIREMSAFLRDSVDPNSEAVVLTLDATLYPGWEDSERIIFDYYPIGDLPVEELRLDTDNVTAANDVLKDPRGLWMVVLWASEDAILEKAERQMIPFDLGDTVADRLLFTPHRLVHIAPIQN